MTSITNQFIKNGNFEFHKFLSSGYVFKYVISLSDKGYYEMFIRTINSPNKGQETLKSFENLVDLYKKFDKKLVTSIIEENNDGIYQTCLIESESVLNSESMNFLAYVELSSTEDSNFHLKNYNSYIEDSKLNSFSFNYQRN